jgi:hypothetical protein
MFNNYARRSALDTINICTALVFYLNVINGNFIFQIRFTDYDTTIINKPPKYVVFFNNWMLIIFQINKK